MGILSGLGMGAVTGFMKGAGDFAKDVRAAVTGKTVITPEDQLKLINAANEMEKAMIAADTQLQLAQVELNKIEASGNWFQKGWRPFLGWLCGVGFLYQFFINPILPWVAKVVSDSKIPDLPALEGDTLMALTFGMLGLASARTVEKVIKGNAGDKK